MTLTPRLYSPLAQVALLIVALLPFQSLSQAQQTQAQPQAAKAPVTTAADAGATANAGAQTRHHALSLVGSPKFPANFKHFDWVNPKAPKGGLVRQQVLGSFDSLNGFTVSGDSAVGLGLIYDQLMINSVDEPSTEYGLIAEWVSYPKDFSSATFRLRKEARFHDGKPITPEDVIFTMQAIKKSHPSYAFYYKNVKTVEKTGPHEVTFRFDVKNNRELPVIVSQLAILPKHYWTGKDATGKQRDLLQSTLEIPLGSGPYKISKVVSGRTIEYERVKDWWAKDLPVVKGQYNFDRLRFSYFRDRTPAFEAFKTGQLDYWDENSSQKWATGYDFPAVRKKLVKKYNIALKTSKPMQAFILNTRRVFFKDRRVREALNLAYDFEWANKNLFYNQYTRTSSYFQNTELASSGLPSKKELAYLEPLRGKIPDEVFTKAFKNPLNKGRRDYRKHLAMAQKKLAAAGWTLRNSKNVLSNKDGKPFKIEFLLISPSFEKVVLPYAEKLKLLGIKSTVRVVDSAQYQRRVKSFDFDIIVGGFSQSHSPGNEQRRYWGSEAAKRVGSRNLIGIQDPAIDKLIDHIIFAKDREDLVAATRALDRVLLWRHYVVPQWFVPYERVAMWEKFGRPAKQPSLSVAFLRAWWYDKDAAIKIEAEQSH